MKTQQLQQPTINLDTDLGWEVFLPPTLLPAELGHVSISPAGLYLETVDGNWDLISFQDLVELLDLGSRSLDECLDIAVPGRNRDLIARLTCPISVVAGQPEPIINGQERVYRRWEADQRYEVMYPGGD